MKTPLHSNEVEKDTVAHNGHEKDKTEGDADPGVVLLKARDARKGEVFCVVAAQVEHGQCGLSNRFCI